MPNLPIRGLGTVGVITDIDPYSLPINAYTRAKNIRFHEGKVTRGPIFRSISGNLSITPKFTFGIAAQSGFDTVLVVDNTFDIFEMTNGSLSQKFNSSLSASANPVTATILADVQYVNRLDTIPVHRTPSANNFTALTNWPSNLRATSMRSYGDFLLALGTVEGSTAFPNRVRFSDPVLANSIPSTWDASDLTNSAGFNDLVQMKTPIVDGATLGSNFLVYSQDQVWMMEFVGGTFIFNFRKLFDDAGVINQNCIKEIEGKHYVFDRDDIYVTDGNTRQSICDGRVRDYIFSGIDNSKADQCFVLHNGILEELYFCYHTGDDMAVFPDGTACNRAAVYNYNEDIWTFQDMPNVVSGTEGNVNSVFAYSGATQSYANFGGSYHDQESPFTRTPLVVSLSGGGVSNSKVYGIDLLERGTLAQSLDTSVSQPFFLERVGLDLDESGIPLSGYKVISRITPQISTNSSNGDFKFTFGAAEIPHATPNYGSEVTFDSLNGYKVDTRMSGRYLSYKMTATADKDFSFTGMDLDITVTGRR
tara:strand:+ start:1170 stop:2771 length:1602 start_codon:yes stop_codon:yes gene_type:complete